MDQQQLTLSYGSNDKINVENYIYNFSEGNIIIINTNFNKNHINSHLQNLDYYDLYGDAFDDQDLYYQPNIDDEPSFWSNLSFAQLCTQCVFPAIWSTCNLLGTTLILCIFFRVFIVIREYKHILLNYYSTNFKIKIDFR